MWKGHGIIIPAFALGAFVVGSIGFGIIFAILKWSVPWIGMIAGLWCAAFAVWLYAVTLGRTSQKVVFNRITGRNEMQTFQHSFLFISPKAWAMIGGLIAVAGSCLLPMVPTPKFKSAKDAPPDQLAFDRANSSITSKSSGIAHGNSAAAIVLAEKFSSSLKLARELGIEQASSKKRKGKAALIPKVSLTGGEFITYCHLTEDTCAFLVHVPDLRKFTSEAKEFICTAAWYSANNALVEMPDAPKSIAVGVRGVLLYESFILGKLVGEEDDPEEGIDERLDGSSKEEMYPYFKEGVGRKKAATPPQELAKAPGTTGDVRGSAPMPSEPAGAAPPSQPPASPPPSTLVSMPSPTAATPPAPMAAATAVLPTPLREWKSADGRPLKAALLKFNDAAGTSAHFKREDGQEFDVPVDKFSPDDQAEMHRLFQEGKPASS